MGASVSDVVERIVRELQERAGNLTAAEAARMSRRSTSRLRHVFTPNAGMNFRTARLRARLEYGRRLLLQTRLTIPEISEQLHYSDRTKFEKAFKRIYGMTPTRYRNQQMASVLQPALYRKLPETPKTTTQALRFKKVD